MNFIKKDYDKYDNPGKKILADYLTSIGHTVTIPEENYGVDLVTQLEDTIWRWEAEIKVGAYWTNSKDFPHNTVSFLQRKQKLGNNWWYAIISELNPTAIVIAHCRSIYHPDFIAPKKIDKGDRKGDDMCYHVPKIRCFWIDTSRP